MVQRVLLDRGLRVSKPGINVLTAGPLDLAFSSDLSQLGILMIGEVDCDWSDFGGPREFGFGKVFPSPPIVHMQRVISAGEYDELSPVGSFHQNLEGISSTNYHEVFAETSNSAIRVRSMRNGTAPNFRLRYTVMDYNL